MEKKSTYEEEWVVEFIQAAKVAVASYESYLLDEVNSLELAKIMKVLQQHKVKDRTEARSLFKAISEFLGDLLDVVMGRMKWNAVGKSMQKNLNLKLST